MESVVYAIVLGSHGWMANDGFFLTRRAPSFAFVPEWSALEGRENKTNTWLCFVTFLCGLDIVMKALYIFTCTTWRFINCLLTPRV